MLTVVAKLRFCKIFCKSPKKNDAGLFYPGEEKDTALYYLRLKVIPDSRGFADTNFGSIFRW